MVFKHVNRSGNVMVDSSAKQGADEEASFIGIFSFDVLYVFFIFVLPRFRRALV